MYRNEGGRHFSPTMRVLPLLSIAVLGLTAAASAETLMIHPPVSGGGVTRSSQLWQDPSGEGNDLDGDAVLFEDFILSQPKAISHLEWWGNGACELGFRVEIWKQDPGTIAYQPYGIWYYGGVDTAEPLITFDTTAYTVSGGPGGLTHYTLELPTPIQVPANTPTNPRWFLCVIGLTAQPYVQWKWAQGQGTGLKCYQFIRASGYIFWALPEGRAVVIGDNAIACPEDLNHDGTVDAADLAVLLGAWGSTGASDLNTDGTVNAADLAVLLGAWGPCG
jgi:hypothetical protein